MSSETAATAFAHLNANKYYVLASTTALLYDHLLTWDREWRLIWKKPFTIPTFFWIIFRYFTPVNSIVAVVAEHVPSWTGKACSNYIWFPVAGGPIVSVGTGVILMLRVHAIWDRALWVMVLMGTIYFAQLAIMFWSIPAGVPAPLPPGFVGCVPSEKPGTGIRLSALYIAALVFDTTIFLLTITRVMQQRLSSTLPIIKLILRDGVLYYAVIFVVNLVNVLLLTLAPADLSAINGPFASMITAILVARLMLNLREAGEIRVHTNLPRSHHTSHQPDNWDFATVMSNQFSEFSAPLGGSDSDRTILQTSSDHKTTNSGKSHKSDSWELDVLPSHAV